MPSLSETKQAYYDEVAQPNEHPFPIAAADGDCEGVLMHLNNGQDVNFSDGLPLIWAAGYGKEKVVEILLNHGADACINDNYPVIVAASHGFPETVIQLLKRGADMGVAIKACLSEKKYNVYGAILQYKWDRVFF